MSWIDKINLNNSVASIAVISISFILMAGFLMTRITKRLRLPNVTAYITAGILIGPYCLNLIPKSIIDGTSFLPDVALAFIAFSTGEFFRLSTLKKNGARVIVITLFEALLASVLVFFVTYFANRGIKKGLKVFFDEEKKEIPKFPNKSIALVIAVISSIAVGSILTPKVILFASNVSFEKTDLVFNFDISFYMFIEPLIKMLIMYCIGIFIGLTIYSVVYYIIVFNRYFDGIDKETFMHSYLIKHIIRYVRYLSIAFAIYTIVGTLDIVFDGFITTSSGLQLTGAGKTDVTIKAIGNILLAITIVVSIFLATVNLKKNERSKLIKNILIIPAYLVCMFVVMIGYDLIFVNPNEYDKEKEYIERNISYTKEAYGINVEDETIEYTGTITTEEILYISNSRNYKIHKK